MDRTDEDVEFQLDPEWDVLSLFQDHESCDKVLVGNTLTPILEISTGDPSPSSHPPTVTLTSDPPHTEHSRAQAAGDSSSNDAIGSTGQGHEHIVDGTEVKIPAEPVSQPKRSSARTNDKSAKPKRVRGPNWAEEEKNALLVLKLEVLTRGPSIKGANWSKDVSKHLLEKYDFDRASRSCQQQWDTLLKDYKSIRNHELMIHSGISTCVSFWKMDEHKRSESHEKLPQVFYKAWYVLMESIIEAAIAAKKTPPIQGTISIKGMATSVEVRASPLSSSIQAPSTTITINSANFTQLGQVSDANRSEPSSSQDQMVSTIPPVAQFSNFVCTDQDSQRHEDEILSMSLPSTSQGSLQRSEEVEALDMPNDDLISRIAPFVNKQIEDKLRSVLRSREEEEQKHREKTLAIEKEMLDLMREKHLLFTHRGTTSMGNFAGISAYAQSVDSLNLASTGLAGQGEHIADDGHAEVNIMQHHPRIS